MNRLIIERYAVNLAGLAQRYLNENVPSQERSPLQKCMHTLGKWYW